MYTTSNSQNPRSRHDVVTPGRRREHAQHVSSLKIYFRSRLTAVTSRILKSLLWSCRHELKAGRPAEVRRHSSIKPCWEFSRSRTFVPSAYNTVCRRLGFGKRRLREQNINRSEPAAPKSQHINSDTAAPREDFSADVNYTTADPGHSATITQQCNNQGGHERF